MAKIGMTLGHCQICLQLGMWKSHKYGLALITALRSSILSAAMLWAMGALYSVIQRPTEVAGAATNAGATNATSSTSRSTVDLVLLLASAYSRNCK